MKKPKWNNIMMIVAIVLIFAYIFYQIYSVTHIELKTETAVVSTVYDSIETVAITVRDEHRVNSSSASVTVPCLSDGDKINVGGNIAMTFSSTDAAASYTKYLELQKKITYYENLKALSLGKAAGIESIDADILNSVDGYIRAINSGKKSAVGTASEKLNDGLLRRQMIIGENVDLDSIIVVLEKERDSYSSQVPSDFITTDVSGVFSSYADGFENIMNYEEVAQATPEQIERAIETAGGETETDASCFGKLITSYEWYFLCSLEASQVKGLKNGQRVQVALKDSDDVVITAEIISGAEVEPKQEKTALILRCSEMNQKLATLRREDIEIRVKAYEGIKVPSEALHISDGKKGVYALISSQAHFRETEVIYSADDYVVLKFDPDNADGIRLYDKIIIQGKGLKDGKSYS